MLKTVFTKVMWVGRATMFAVGLAVVLALVLGVASTALAGKNSAPTFNLNVQNAVSAVSSLVGSIAGPVLRLDNNSTDPNATALDLQVEPGKAPMTVNSDGKVTNLNADKLDGQEASAFLPAGGKATDAAHADRADTAGSATSAATAQNADQLDGQDSAAFLRSGGKAADADKLDGKDGSAFAIRTDHNYQPAHDCDTPAVTECAPVTVTVPANKTYYVSVWSSFSAKGVNTRLVSYCAAGRGPGIDPNNPCITPYGKHNVVTAEADQITAGSSSGETIPLSGGASGTNYTFSTWIGTNEEFATHFQGIVITKVMVRDTANSF